MRLDEIASELHDLVEADIRRLDDDGLAALIVCVQGATQLLAECPLRVWLAALLLNEKCLRECVSFTPARLKFEGWSAFDVMASVNLSLHLTAAGVGLAERPLQRIHAVMLALCVRLIAALCRGLGRSIESPLNLCVEEN